MTEKNIEKSETYRFGTCVLDADRRELLADGESVTTQPKAFELLLYLVRNRHRAVDKDELQDKLWPRSIVTETALTRCVMKARRAVGDDAERQVIIKTVHGHGYRFIADVEDASPANAPNADSTTSQTTRSMRSPAIAASLVLAVGALWWFLAPPAYSDSARLAVLPVENATGEPDLDWARTGFMVLMNRMLEDRSVAVVSGRSIGNLAGDKTNAELTAADSEFRATLQKTTGFTHILATTLQRDGDLYRLTFTISSDGGRPEQRTVVGPEPSRLITQIVDIVSTLMTSGVPESPRRSVVSDDDFINEAYARAMGLEFEGRYEEARRMFQIIIEQNSELFWPRYEFALCTRNLRDFETAERLFIELRDETEQDGQLKRQAAVNNSLGVMYMGRRRNDEARDAFETTVRLATEANAPKYSATAHLNLGLLAKSLGDLPLAYEYMQTSVKFYTDQGIESLPGALLNNLSGVLIQMGDLEQAEPNSLAAIENFRLTGERLYESYALSRLATIYRRKGLLTEAEDAAQQSYSVREELGDRRGVAASLLTLATIASERGDLTRSLQYAQEAEDIGTEIDDTNVIVSALLKIAKAELLLGRPRDAAGRFAAAEAIARNNEDRVNVFASRYGIAKSWIEIGDYAGATSIADELLTDSRENDRRREETAGMNLYADIYVAQEQWSNAIAELEQVLSIADDIGDQGLAAGAHANLAKALFEIDRIEEAKSHIDIIVAERPDDADVLRLQARLASVSGEADQAVDWMTLARNKAGESWQTEDDALLQSYQQSAAELAKAAVQSN